MPNSSQICRLHGLVSQSFKNHNAMLTSTSEALGPAPNSFKFVTNVCITWLGLAKTLTIRMVNQPQLLRLFVGACFRCFSLGATDILHLFGDAGALVSIRPGEMDPFKTSALASDSYTYSPIVPTAAPFKANGVAYSIRHFSASLLLLPPSKHMKCHRFHRCPI